MCLCLWLDAYQRASTALRDVRTVTDSSGRVSHLTAASIEEAVDAFQDEVGNVHVFYTLYVVLDAMNEVYTMHRSLWYNSHNVACRWLS